MPIPKTMYTCSVSGKLFETEEQALRSEELTPKVRLWTNSVRERVGEALEGSVKKLTELFQVVNDENGSPFIPFTATVSNGKVVISVRNYSNPLGMPAAQGVMWEALHDLMLGFGEGGNPEQFSISNISVLCIIIEMSEYYSGTGKYAIQEPVAEPAEEPLKE